MPVIIAFMLFFLGFHFSQESKQVDSQNRSIASLNESVDQGVTPVEFSGELLAEADDTSPNHKQHRINYYVKDSKKNLHKIELLNPDESKIGNTVLFRGNEGNGSSIGSISTISERVRVPLVREHKMLILLFKFNNSMTEYTNAEEVRKAVFNGAFQQFYRDMSDKKEIHTGKVYGFYHLNRNGDDDGGADMPCNVSPDEIKEAAAHYQIDLKQYTQITTVSNCTEYSTIGGRANLSDVDFLGIGKKQHYIKMAAYPPAFKFTNQHPYVPGWGGFVSILVHERGHNFGLSHSNSLDCGDSKILYPCSDIEYGNRFDRMGGPSGSFLFNAYQQEKGGWKTANEFLHIKTSGIYTIDKLTSTNPNRKIGAYIYNPKNLNQKLFMLEFRTPDGMDNNLSNPVFASVKNGAQLYTAFGASNATLSPNIETNFRIVDPHPTNLNWDEDTIHESLQGEYFDARSGIKITTYSAYPEKIEFKVEYDTAQSVCDKSPLIEWSSNPYVKLYYELEPQVATQVRIGEKPGSGSTGGPGPAPIATTPPPYNKEIKHSHIVLVPGDFFHLKIDTQPGDPMICERTNMEIQVLNYLDLQGYFLSTVNANSFKRTTKNIPQKLEFPILRVPPVELNRDRVLRYQIKNKITGETMERKLYLHIRSSHNAIIPLESTQER